MAKNYVKYLNRQSEENKKEEQKTFLEKANGMIGLGIGLGLGAAFLRSGSAKDLSIRAGRFLSNGGKTLGVIGESIGTTMKGRSALSFFRSDVQDEIQERLTGRLTQSYLKRSSNAVSGSASRLEREVFNLKYVKEAVRDSYITDLRRQSITSRMRNSGTANDEFIDELDTLLKKDRGWKNSYSVGTFEKYLEKQKIDVSKIDQPVRQQIFDYINDTRPDNYANWVQRDFGQSKGLNGALVDNHINDVYNKIEKSLIDEFIENNNNSVMSKVLGDKSGYRHLTVNEAVQRDNMFNNIPVSELADDGSGRMLPTGRMINYDASGDVQDLLNRHPQLKDAMIDPGIFTNGADIEDIRGLTEGFNKVLGFTANNLQIPIVGIKPLRLLHYITAEGIQSAPEMAILRAGTKQPWLTGSIEDLSSDVVVSGSRAYDITTGSLMKENIDLGSAQYGIFNRVASNMMNFHTKEGLEDGVGAVLQDIFDIGRQEQDIGLLRKLEGYTKFVNPGWVRNQYTAATTGTLNSGAYENFFDQMYKSMNDNVGSLNKQTLDILSPHIKNEMGYLLDNAGELMDLNMSSSDEVLGVLSRMVSAESNNQTATMNRLRGLFNEWTKNPEAFLKARSAINQSEEFVLGIAKEETNLISRVEVTKKAIHQEIVSQLDRSGVLTDDLLGTDAAGSLKDMLVMNRMEHLKSLTGEIRPGVKEGHANFVGWINDPVGERDTLLKKHTDDMVNKFIPLWSEGPASAPPKPFGNNVPYLVINKSRNPIESLNEALAQGEGLNGALKAFMKDSFGQAGIDFGFGYRAGSKNLGDVSTFTAGTYYYLDRINEAMGNVGVGLSPKNMGSLQDAWANITLRRMIYPALAIGGVGYLNYEIGNVTGKKPGDKMADTYANMKMDVAWLKDKLGLNEMGSWANNIMPGVNQLTEESPFAMAASAATFGLLGSSKTEDELYKEYTDGEVAVRKGRWWPLGNTPWMGGKVEYYAPGSYRRTTSNYKKEALYGSEGEYWAHSFVPNPRNAFGLRNLLEPDYLANKHREDRPYPTTGGYEELRMIPIVGPIADATIGNILNPPTRREDLGKAHREFLTSINKSIEAEISQQEQGAYAYILPGGGIKINAAGVGTPIGYGGGSPAGVYIGGEGQPGGIIPVDMNSAAGQEIEMYGTIGAGASAARSQITSMNQNTIAGAVGGGGVRSGGINALRNLDYIDDIMSLSSMSGVGYQLAESYYSTTQIGGMYGFMSTSFTGDMISQRPVLEDARDIDSLRRSFWDLNLGGIGGNFSEIGRRFLPSQRRQPTYNPYENLMPEWIPGCFVAGTEVFTSKGSVLIENMNIGDKVLTHNGKFMNVQWVNVKKYSGNFITVEIDGIKDPITCTEDHPFLVMKTAKCPKIHGYCTPFNEAYDECKNCKRQKYGELKWIPASQITKGDFVVEVFPISDCTIGEIQIPRIPGCKELFRYTMPMNWITGIMCGIYAARRSFIDNRLSVCYNYDDIIGDFCYMFNIDPVYNKYDIEVKEKQITEWMRAHFKNNSIPSWIYDTSDEFKAGFLSAYIDTKSSAKPSKNEIVINDPPSGMHQLLGTLGIYVVQYENKIFLNADDIYKLKILIGAYGKLAKFIPESKTTKHTPAMNNFILHKVTKLSSFESEELVYNLQVAGDHTYNVQGVAVHNSEYFTDFKHGDPFTKVKLGEARLPGVGYEALNQLHSDAVFGKYGAVERFKILGDVAPYSQQYKYYTKVLTLMNQAGMLSEEDKAVINETKDQLRDMRKPFDLYDYKFKNIDLDKRRVTVDYVIDNNTFVTREDPNNPIRLAGIRLLNDDSEETKEIESYLEQYIKPGASLIIGTTNDSIQKYNMDTMSTMDAVIYDKWGDPIQANLANRFKSVRIKDSNLSPVDVAALNSGWEITVGKLWESFAHLDTPFHTKFLQVRSGVEMYERRDVFGKAFQSWDNPIDDYVIPWWQNMAKNNPIIATALGAGFGSLFGGRRAGRMIGALIGGTSAGMMSSMRVFDKLMSGGKYESIPERRRKEREVNEYFDKIKYMKFKGLYEKTAALARRKEGVDIRDFIGDEGRRGKANAALRRKLEKKKQILKIRQHDPLAYEDRVQVEIDAINAKLAEIAGDKKMVKLGPLSLQALKYKDEYESTLYGMDSIDYQKLWKALPKRERAYFQSFSTADPKDRQRILELIPKDQRRVFQAMWGMKAEEKEKMETYFKDHFLPDSDWSGWRPDVDLEAVKIKVMKQEGVDLKDAGYWDDQPTNIRPTAKLNNMRKMSSFINPDRIKEVLRGAGLKDIELQYAIGPADDANAIAINIDNNKSLITDFTSLINDRGI